MTMFQEIKEEIIKNKYKVIVNLLISIVIGFIMAYYSGVSIYEEEGCSNSLNIIFSSGLIGFCAFFISVFICMVVGLFLSFMFEGLIKGKLDVDWG